MRSIRKQEVRAQNTEIFIDTLGCGSELAGLLFFLSFYLVVPLVFLNLFIAIILEGFETTN
jgi:hypothetical protein